MICCCHGKSIISSYFFIQKLHNFTKIRSVFILCKSAQYILFIATNTSSSRVFSPFLILKCVDWKIFSLGESKLPSFGYLTTLRPFFSEGNPFLNPNKYADIICSVQGKYHIESILNFFSFSLMLVCLLLGQLL